MALAFHDHELARCGATMHTRRSVTRRPSRHRPPSRRPCPARVFARRRAVAGTVVVVLGVASLSTAWAVLGAVGGVLAPTPPARPAAVERPVVVRTVEPGDTLWAVAGSLGGGGDIRARVDELARLNGGGVLRAGDTIRIPAEWIGGRR